MLIEVDLDHFSMAVGLNILVFGVFGLTSSISRLYKADSVQSGKHSFDAPEATTSKSGQSFSLFSRLVNLFPEGLASLNRVF